MNSNELLILLELVKTAKSVAELKVIAGALNVPGESHRWYQLNGALIEKRKELSKIGVVKN